MQKTCFAALLWTAIACAQPQGGNSVVSPEVLPDRHVTFRIFAPKATDVAFYADWKPVGTSEKMTKDDGGVWSITTGPVDPGIYIYNFIVDGMTIADPVNPRMKLRARTSASLLEVPGTPAALWEARDVPHGTVEINYEKAKALNGETRWIWVYTPPGYDRDTNRRYPVLYLFHGSNDTAGGWVLAGGANFILDNLIAAKTAVPMIVVMPFGHAVPFGAPREQQAKNTSLFDEYLRSDVLPLVESKYRIQPGRENRAIAGLSMGGGQSLTIGFSHLDLFSAVGAFSAAVPADFETRFGDALKDPAGTNQKLKLLWIGCGRQDGLFERSQKLSEMLDAHQIRNTFRASEGAHTYTVWRMYLGEFVPLLFRPPATQADWRISMEPEGKVRCNYPAQVKIKVKDATAAVVDGANVDVVLSMPGMDHGEFTTVAQAAQDGVYQAKPTFYMVGKWNVAVRVTKGNLQRIENFSYDVKE